MALAGLFSGCAGDSDDRAFFNRGWINPKELDNPPQVKFAKPTAPPGYKRDPLID